MSIYHVLINTLNAHIIHINLNTILYTYVEDSPANTIYIWHYMETHTHTHTHTYSSTIVTYCSILIVVPACHFLSNVQVYSVPAFHSLYSVFLLATPCTVYLVPTHCI